MSTINGTPADDVLTGSPADDLFNGLAGFDTARVSAASGDAVFSLDGQGRWVVSSPQGVDTLIGVEAVQFATDTVEPVVREFRVNTVTAGNQTAPVLTTLADGQLLVTWLTATGVRAQRFDTAGVRIGSEVQGPPSGPHDTAPADDGGYLIAWVDETSVVGGFGRPVSVITVSRFDTTGTFQGSVALARDELSQSGSKDVGNPAIVALTDGSFLVTWDALIGTSRGQGRGMEARHLDSNGVPTGATLTLPGGSDVAALPDGGYAVVYGSPNVVNVQHFDNTGAFAGSTRIDAPGSSAPKISALTEGGYVVAWTVPAEVGWGDVYAQRFSSTGAAQDAAVRVNASVGSAVGPVVTPLTQGGYVVAWTSQGQAGAEADIHAQRFDATGAPIAGEIAVNTVLPGLQQQPTLTALADGGFVVGWTSSGEGVDGRDIFAQRFDSSGAAVPGEHGLKGDEHANWLVFSGDQSVYLVGGGGDDVLQGGSGDDLIDGGAGFDTAVSADLHSAISWQLPVDRALHMTGPQSGDDALLSVEQVRAEGARIGIELDWNSGVRLVDSGSVNVPLLFPSVAVLRDGSSVLTWERAGGSDVGLYAQRFDQGGAAAGEALRIEAGGKMSVAALADGGYVLAWSFSTSWANNSSAIDAQRFDASGTAVGPRVRVNTTELGNAGDAEPLVAALADGGYAVTWTKAAYLPDSGVFTRQFHDGGLPVTPETRVNATAGPYPGEQAIAALDDGGYVVTWTMGEPGTWPNDSGYDIYAQRFDSQGTAVGAQARANATATGHQFRSEVAGLADGGYVVSWMTGTAIMAQRFDATGTPVGAETWVNPSSPQGDQVGPGVAALADGGYVVAWRSGHYGASGITTQRFDASGARVGGEQALHTTTAHGAGAPALAALEDGGYTVIWLTYQSEGYRIERERFDANNLREGHLTLTGGAEDNVLRLTSAVEGAELIGGAGDDVLAAAGGWNALTGGSGGDTFEFAAVRNGVDTITDWAPGDRISIAGASFSGGVTPGTGASVALNGVESSIVGGATMLYIGTDVTPGADVTIRLRGVFAPGDFSVRDNLIEWTDAPTEDTTAPVAIHFFPAPGSAMLPPDWQPGITFSEPVQAGPGTITLETAGGQLVQTFGATDPRVQFMGANVVIDPAGDLQPGSTYRLIVAPGAIEDLAGNPYAGESDFTFTTTGEAPAPGDTRAPQALDFFPAAGSRMLPPDWTLGITFDESVRAGPGAITLQTAAGEVVQTFSAGRDPGVRFSGAVLMIDPAADLRPGTTYRLIVDPDAVEDLAGNAYAGRSDHTFTTAGDALPPADITAPLAVDFFPAAGSRILPADWSLAITFSEDVKPGSGTLTLQTAAGEVVQTFDAATDPGIQFTGNSVIINPTSDLQPGTTYRLIVGPDAVQDLSGNAYPGESGYAFTTAGAAPQPRDTTPPMAVDFFPAPGSNTLPPDWSLAISFSEAVAAGSGTITLKTTAGQVVQTFAAATDPGIWFNGSSLVINPAADLQPGATYNLVVAPDAVQDLAGNPYAGESDYVFAVSFIGVQAA